MHEPIGKWNIVTTVAVLPDKPIIRPLVIGFSKKILKIQIQIVEKQYQKNHPYQYFGQKWSP